MSAPRDWETTAARAQQLEGLLVRFVEPVAELFVGDASQPRQRRRLELVAEALRRLAARAQREIEHEAAARERAAVRVGRLASWQERVDELRAEEGRDPVR